MKNLKIKQAVLTWKMVLLVLVGVLIFFSCNELQQVDDGDTGLKRIPQVTPTPMNTSLTDTGGSFDSDSEPFTIINQDLSDDVVVGPTPTNTPADEEGDVGNPPVVTATPSAKDDATSDSISMITATPFENILPTPTVLPEATPQLTPSVIPVVLYAFTGGDMESEMHDGESGLSPKKSGYSTDESYNGEQSLHIVGNVSSNTYAFVSGVTLEPVEGAKKLVFMIKGTSAARGFSINIGSTTDKQIFNSGEITGDTTLTMSTRNVYSGSVYCPEWTKITLDISQISDIERYTLSFKIGKDSDWDIYLDDFYYEF